MEEILLIASKNKHKLKEIRHILKGIPFKLKSLADVGCSQNIKETGTTYKENARMKAEIVGKKIGFITLAEDSALEIDVLQGIPGIRSARYVPGKDQDRINKILEELKGVTKNQRTARFICVTALFEPQKNKTYFFEGESRGLITEKPFGKNGFDYDPIFYNLDLKKTNAQASLKEKNLVSHRARALLKAKQFLLLHTYTLPECTS